MKNFLYGEPHINMIIDMTEKEAIEHLAKIGYTMLVINRDSTPLMTLQDYNAKRVKVFVNQGYVNDIDQIG